MTDTFAPAAIDQFAAQYEAARAKLQEGINLGENSYEAHLIFCEAANMFELAGKFTRNPAEKRKAASWQRSAERNSDRYYA